MHALKLQFSYNGFDEIHMIAFMLVCKRIHMQKRFQSHDDRQHKSISMSTPIFASVSALSCMQIPEKRKKRERKRKDCKTYEKS